jgi:hypothetical protein
MIPRNGTAARDQQRRVYVRSACGELLGCERSKNIEFVAVRVGHHHPAGIGALPYVDATRAKSLEPSHFSSLILRP